MTTYSSIRALAAKEFYHLLPLIFALIALELLGLLDWFVSQSPDEIAWADLSMFLDPELSGAVGVAYVIVGIVAAYMLFPHERTQTTLEFLWSLPIARWQIYIVKLSTAFAVLATLIILGHLLLLGVHEFGVGSISRTQFSWRLWSLELVSLISLTAIALGYGALVACFRTIGVLAFLGFWMAAVVLTYMDASYEYFNVATLLIPEFRGTEVLLSTKAWTLHAVIALLCIVLAGFLFVRDNQPPAHRNRTNRLGSRIVTTLMVLLALFLIIAYATSVLAPGLTNPDQQGTGAEGRLQSVETQYYEFSYYSDDQVQAQILLSEADQLSERVQELLDTTPNDLILADLTDNSADHLGIAGWKKLRIERSALYDAERRAHVLVHETAHVLAAAASDRRLTDYHNVTSFFNEGLAEWASYEVLGLEQQRHALHLLAALAWQRLDLRFSDFQYVSSFRARYDENLIYALGEAWVSTLADVCGNQAPGAALKAMARPGAPQQLQGDVFWRDTLQSIGCDLTAVNGRFALLMRDYQSHLTNVPSLTGAIEAKDAQLVTTLTLAGGIPDETYKVFIRVRDDPGASPASVFSESAEMKTGQTLTLELPRAMISGQRFQYQLGIAFLPGERPFFGRWIDEG